MIRRHDCRRLSSRQRARLPEAIELDEIDDRLDAIQDKKQALLECLTHVGATTPQGLAAKLAIVASMLHRHGDAVARDLVSSALDDLQRLTRIKSECPRR